jgi:3',5'-cyclic AMP phosphodiesterase CpdA
MRTIAHISDLHFGRHDELVAESLLSSIWNMRPDIVVLTGDLTQRGRHRQFAAARAFLEKLPRPVLVIPGNHDVPLYDLVERFLGRLTRYRRYISAELQPFFMDDEIALLGLNTARSATFTNGRISNQQAAAIRATFSAVPAGRFRMIATHHPLIAEGNASIVGRAPMALRAMAAAGVHLVLSGHRHRAYSGDLPVGDRLAARSFLVVHAGTAISTRLRGEPNSYNILRIDEGQVSCTVQTLRDKRFAETTEFALLGGRWTRQ